MEAAKLAEVRNGDDLTAQKVVNLEKPAKAHEAVGGMPDRYRVIRNGQDFSVEGFFSKDDRLAGE
jgi:hypothetical protein